MPAPFATLPVADLEGLRLVLPRSLWPRPLHIGERVLVTSSAGDQWCPLAVDCDAQERPFVTLPCRPDTDARRLFVRLVRAA